MGMVIFAACLLAGVVFIGWLVQEQETSDWKGFLFLVLIALVAYALLKP